MSKGPVPLLLEAGDSPPVAKVSNPAASVRNGDGAGAGAGRSDLLQTQLTDGQQPASGPIPEQRRNNGGVHP